LQPTLVVSIQNMQTLDKETDKSIPTSPNSHPQTNNERNTNSVKITTRWPNMRRSKKYPITIKTTKKSAPTSTQS
ncbi:hypothetical protein AIZ09_23215, partial [Salmonella enterica subsp. enterica serovar Typhimurium]